MMTRRGIHKRLRESKTLKGKKFFKRNTGLRIPVRDEVKQADLISSNYAFSTTPTITLLNGVSLGSDNFNRIGRKIFMKSLQVRGSIRRNGAVQNTDEYCRMAIVYDRQPNFAAPVYGDIFQMTTTAGATSSTSESLPNEANKNRFLILKDFQWDYPGTVVSGDTNPSQVINWFIPLNDMVTHYLGTGATAADISTGSLWLIDISRNLTAVNSQWQFTVSFRLRYVES